jgi:uncharacterized delta-60 repeat protein
MIRAVPDRWNVCVGAVACVIAVGLVASAFAGASGGRHLANPTRTGSNAARVQSSGTGSFGIVLTDFGRGRDDVPFGVAVQRDGKILVAGVSRRGGYSGPGDIAVARYERNGRLDTDFGAGGKVLVPVGSAGSVGAVAALPNGKILAGGSTLVRLVTDGNLDPSFATRGKLTTGFAWTFAIQRDGKIVAAGEANLRFAIARYGAKGQIDRGFGVNGRATANFGSGSVLDASDYATAVGIQSDQKIVAIGTATECGMCVMAHFALARYTVTGRLDPSFGTHGIVETEFNPDYSHAMTGALQKDDKIIAAGYWDDAAGAALARYRPDGHLDATFGSGGRVRSNSRSTVVLSALAIQRDGKIVVSGWRKASDTRDAVVFRYSSHGALDPSFRSAGTTLRSFDNAQAITPQRDGTILVAGTSDKGDFALARLTANGRLDPNFGSTGP